MLALVPIFVAKKVRLSKFTSAVSTGDSCKSQRGGLRVLGSPRAKTFTVVDLYYCFLLYTKVFDRVQARHLFTATLIFIFSHSLDKVSIIAFRTTGGDKLLQAFRSNTRGEGMEVMLVL